MGPNPSFNEDGFGIAILIIMIGGSIPFLAYLGYKFVLGGFYPEEDVFNRDVDSDATKKTDDLDE